MMTPSTSCSHGSLLHPVILRQAGSSKLMEVEPMIVAKSVLVSNTELHESADPNNVAVSREREAACKTLQ